VVQVAWIERRPLEAVAVLKPPSEPYYALPFGDLEWGITAETELASTPPLEAKYLPRKVEEQDVEAEAWPIVSAIPKRNRYRRYFRELGTGFGSVGGQGGKF
jgi:hypothetical protein